MAVDKLVDSAVLDGYFSDIADAIRDKDGTQNTYTPAQMPQAIEDIPTGGGGGDTFNEIVLSKTATTYTNNSFTDTIRDYAFYLSFNLREVNMPRATSIGSYVFNLCSALQTVDLSSARSIGSSAFSGCSALQTVDFSSVTGIAGNAFMNAFATDTEVSFPALTQITGYNVFNGAKIKNISFPNIISIGNSAFNSCRQLKSIICPKTLTTLGNQAFKNCVALESIVFGGNLPSSGINSGTFAGCTACILYDFSNCTTIPPLLSSDVFTGINANAHIVVPDALYNDWIAATNWSTYALHIIKKTDYDAL